MKAQAAEVCSGRCSRSATHMVAGLNGKTSARRAKRPATFSRSCRHLLGLVHRATVAGSSSGRGGGLSLRLGLRTARLRDKGIYPALERSSSQRPTTPKPWCIVTPSLLAALWKLLVGVSAVCLATSTLSPPDSTQEPCLLLFHRRHRRDRRLGRRKVQQQAVAKGRWLLVWPVGLRALAVLRPTHFTLIGQYRTARRMDWVRS